MTQPAPHNAEVERALLGSMLTSTEALDMAIERLVPGDFYSTRNGVIYAAVVALVLSGKAVDHLSLADHLTSEGKLEAVGGLPYISELTTETASSPNVSGWCGITKSLAKRRRLINIGARLQTDAYNEEISPDKVHATAESDLTGALLDGERSSFQPVERTVSGTLDAMEKMHRGEWHGLSTGFRELDHMTGGWQKGDLIIVAGRPSMGKTALAMSFALTAAQTERKSTVIFSLEMSTSQLQQRLMCMMAQASLSALRNGELSREKYTALVSAGGELSDLPLYIDDGVTLDVAAMRSRVRRVRGVGLVVIDYLQLIPYRGTAQNRVGEIADISRGLKFLAKEFDVPVICLSQLSRETEKRHSHRPIMADLRDGGSIEQDADVVLFPFRPGVYDTTDETGEVSLEGEAELIVSKQRNGPTGVVRDVEWLSYCTVFRDKVVEV